MFRHNFLLTYRNFKRYKSSFFINLIGLSTALACVLLIHLWVTDEMKVDKFHANDNQLYQVFSNHTDASGIFTWKGVPGLLLEEIEATVPEVNHAIAMTDTHEFTISVDETYLKANGKFASNQFLNVFTYPLIEGDRQSALGDKSSIVITRSLAERLFKTSDAIGKHIDWQFQGIEKTFLVTGILEDIPQNSSDQFDYIMSWDFYHNELITYKNWTNYYARIVVVLNSNADANEAGAKIDALLKEHHEDDRVTLFLTKYSDKYLFGKYENGMQSGGRIEYVNLFLIVAIFILFIACINFINLSTAKASHRTKEIGVKKSMGASRRSLIGQYFTESILLSVISLIVASILVLVFLPQFNFIAQKQLSLELDDQLIYAMVTLVILTGIIAGSYPALYLSGFKVLDILKGKLSKKIGDSGARKALVVVQFTLSIILIVSVTVVHQQVEFIKDKNLGYDRDNLIYFEKEGKLTNDYETFINEMNKIPGIENASVSGFLVGGGNSTGGVSWEGKTDEDQIQFWEISSGYGLIEMLGIELVEGRLFSNEFTSDSTSIIFNETAIAAMGLENPIGKTIEHYTGNKQIIGVIKDFNLISLHTKMEPMLFLHQPEDAYYIMAKIRQGSEKATIDQLALLCKSFNPGYPLDFKFIDQDYQALYTSEELIGTLSKYFAVFAILISCLGLFGLAAFTTERRFKEIGIRKVLGSSSLGVVYMLSADFTKMVLAAIVISLPVSYLISSKWLDDYAYRIELEWWFFVGSAVAALVIAWVTVGFQTFKAASINPSECLRDD